MRSATARARRAAAPVGRLLGGALLLVLAGGAAPVRADGETVATILGGTVAGLVGVFLLVVLIKLIRSIKVVEKGTAMIVERFGKFHRRLDAGLYFLLPWVDAPRPLIYRAQETVVTRLGSSAKVEVDQHWEDRVDLREAVLDFPTQEIITRDNVNIRVHPMVLYRVIDPVRIVYECFDLYLAVEKLIQTTLRSIIGDMGLDDTLASREEINRALQQKISNTFLNWGFKLIKVDILEIMPATASIQEAMHKQISAERMRRAKVIEADGFREMTKTEAEGECAALIAVSRGEQQVAVISAKGHADAKLLKANAEAEAIRTIGAALKDFDIDATRYIVALKYIEVLKKIACGATSRDVYLPLEHDVIGGLSELVASQQQ